MTRKKVSFTYITGKPAASLKVGDTVRCGNVQATIKGIFVHHGRKVIQTDRLGLIYENELVVRQ